MSLRQEKLMVVRTIPNHKVSHKKLYCTALINDNLVSLIYLKNKYKYNYILPLHFIYRTGVLLKQAVLNTILIPFT